MEEEEKAEREGEKPKPQALIAGDGYVQFGSYGDLCVDGDLSECSSLLEQSYGIGLTEEGKECYTLLAGSHFFSIDSIEVFEIVSVADTSRLKRGGK